jgi:hypothetical protein
MRGDSIRSRILPGLLAALPLLLGACESQLEGSDQGGNVPGGGTTGGSGTAGDTATGGSGGSTATGGGGSAGTTGGTAGVAGTGGSGGPDCSEPQAIPTHARLLAPTQYDNSILDILKVSGTPSRGFGQGLDDVALEQRANVAAAVASQAVASLSQWAPCTPPASGSAEACELRIIDEVGAKLLRHPLSDGDRARLKTLFDAGILEKDFATGAEWFLTGILQTPDFMYEMVRPAPSETPGEVRPLAAHEYANRLAFFLWDGPADDALALAAASGELEDATERQAQITRMLGDARFTRGLTQFYRQWLSMKGFAEIARDVETFDQEVVTALSTSLLMSVTELYKQQNPNISSLFSGDTYYLNDVLRGFYGVSGSGSGFAPASMAGQSRRGILTHPGMMALLARPEESFPIGRGLHLLRTVLCEVISAPPPGLAIPPQPPLQEGVSTRERLAAHTAGETCQGCHATINPAGFVFEAFDEVGRFRTTDHGRPVDSSGTLELGSDIDGAFATGDELLEKLGDSQRVRACFAQKYLDFALALQVSLPENACSAQALGQSFGASGDLKELAVAVAQSDSFRLRLAEGVAP